jgi:hypothetical protein
MYHPLLLLLLQERFMLPCMSKQVFGIDCPGCGLQRSIVLLFKGDLVASFQMYPALFPMTVLFGFLALNRFVFFKKANAITIGLASLTVFSILANYALKLFN